MLPLNCLDLLVYEVALKLRLWLTFRLFKIIQMVDDMPEINDSFYKKLEGISVHDFCR